MYLHRWLTHTAGKKHQYIAPVALDSQQVARLCGGSYAQVETRNVSA